MEHHMCQEVLGKGFQRGEPDLARRHTKLRGGQVVHDIFDGLDRPIPDSRRVSNRNSALQQASAIWNWKE